MRQENSGGISWSNLINSRSQLSSGSFWNVFGDIELHKIGRELGTVVVDVEHSHRHTHALAVQRDCTQRVGSGSLPIQLGFCPDFTGLLVNNEIGVRI